MLPAAARNYLEAVIDASGLQHGQHCPGLPLATMTSRYHSDFAHRYYDQGWAEGEVEGKAEGRRTSLMSIRSAPLRRRDALVAGDLRCR